ncbi:MAG: fibronectin type III domain-containing protein [Chloroflexota bacterium]|nr:fibronectin type III domain-containing protein [Chloroflexota bacterium]
MLDTSVPTATAPAHTLVNNANLGNPAVLVSLAWAGSDTGSGVARYELQRRTDSGSWTAVALPSRMSTLLQTWLAPGHSYTFRVRSHDRAGNASAWRQGATFRINAYQESHSGIRYTSPWYAGPLTGSYGGSVKYSIWRGARATFTIPRGTRSIGWVSTRSDRRGITEIRVDGVVRATVDLYSPTPQPRRMVFVQTGLDPTITHTIEVRMTGLNNPSSRSRRVDVDAFVTMR